MVWQGDKAVSFTLSFAAAVVGSCYPGGPFSQVVHLGVVIVGLLVRV